MAHRVTFIPGDGTGPEISEAVRRVLEGTGVEFEWDWQDAGADVYEEEGTPLPDRVLDSIRERGLAIKGPITTPVGSGFRSINVALRQELDLYACLRPCKAYEGVRTRFPETDIVIVRENHEDLYAGIEFEMGDEKTEKLRKFIEETEGTKLREDMGILDQADLHLRHPADRARGVRVREGLRAQEGDPGAQGQHHEAHRRPVPAGGGARWPRRSIRSIEFEDRIIDNLCNQLVSRPEEYDVLVLPNLYGDIVSDLCAGMIGGLGLAPGANIGDDYAVFEATHGSAPKYKGQNKVNPMALMLSGVMLLRHIEETEAADRLETAIADVIREGEWRDLRPEALARRPDVRSARPR